MAAAPSPGPLTPAQLAAFHRDGYLLLPGALSPPLITSLLAETTRLLSTLDITTHPLTQFHAGDTNHVGDAYFLSSATNISFFLEPSAFSPTDPPVLLHPPARAVNKIGHYLHALSPPFASLLASGTVGNVVDVAALARQLSFRDPRCLQSMTILKQPGIGGAVPAHQDSTFLYTNPPSAVGLWYALEDATRENGCLSFLPGSHLWKGVEKRMVRKEGGGTEMGGGRGGAPGGGEEDGKYVMGEVEAGTLVLIHGNLLHKSERNTSEKGRIAYTFHVIEGEEEYDERNWLQPPEEGFTRVIRD
ncbi:hypothetical protein B0T18DRAFT_434971 [Schizothecium vesticola]|uniref:Phytanoyl-CoA dioxygenase n=1 Tax=Schizothecium vesticola TaxID=314040 RepID=A0AA40FC77_9PEZI|nr:hypothetical protein B0T18DRAFT_434971 [Schizothecium vesticola]